MPGDTTIQTLVLWAAALTTLFNFGALLWGTFSGPSRKNSSAIEALTTRMTNVEQSLRIIPSKEEMHDLELAMSDLRGEIKTMSETMRGQNEIMKRLELIVGRHEQHLLESKR